MIDNIDRNWIIIMCDECDEEIDIGDDFYETLQYAKDLGWKIFKEDDEWTHLCPDCFRELK